MRERAERKGFLERTVGCNELVVGGVGMGVGLIGAYRFLNEEVISFGSAFYAGLGILSACLIKHGRSLIREKPGIEKKVRE